MSLKTFKSYTKSVRGTVLVDKKDLWKGKPVKSLTFGKSSTGGRNNLGRITSRHKGGGVKHKFRIIDFLRNKKNLFLAGSAMLIEGLDVARQETLLAERALARKASCVVLCHDNLRSRLRHFDL